VAAAARKTLEAAVPVTLVLLLLLCMKVVVAWMLAVTALVVAATFSCPSSIKPSRNVRGVRTLDPDLSTAGRVGDGTARAC